MAAFHDAIEMASSDDEDVAGSAGSDDNHPDFIDDELPFLDPAARADMTEGSDGEAEGVELPGLASEESEGEDEHARPPPPPVLPARQGTSHALLVCSSHRLWQSVRLRIVWTCAVHTSSDAECRALHACRYELIMCAAESLT